MGNYQQSAYVSIVYDLSGLSTSFKKTFFIQGYSKKKNWFVIENILSETICH